MKVFLVLDWKINQDIITEKYCENKDKPMLNCNGQCYLAKQLEQLEQQENQERSEHPNPQQVLEKADYLSFFSAETCNFSFISIESPGVKGEHIVSMVSQPHLSRIKAPPQV